MMLRKLVIPMSVARFGDDDDVTAKITAAVEAANTAAAARYDTDTAGLKSKVEEALKEKKSLAGKLAAFDGLDPAAMKVMMSRFENDEEAQLLAAGKVDEVVAKRIEKREADFTTRETTLTEENNGLKEENAGWKGKYNRRTVETNLRALSEKAGAVPGAIDDIIRRGIEIFTVGEDDALEARDKEGNLRMTDDKKNVLTPEVWIGLLKESENSLHYFPGSQGAGAAGSGGAGHKQSDIDAAMDKAADAGDMVTYKRLRMEKKKAASGR